MTRALVVDVMAGLRPGGGIGRYVRDLVTALTTRPDAPEAWFAYPRDLRAAAAALPVGRRRELPLPWPMLRALYTAGLVLPLRFDRLFAEPAVVHSPVGYGPAFGRARLIAHVHDLTSIEHPEWHPVRAQRFLGPATAHAARHAATVLTHSRFVAGRVHAALGVPASRIATIPPPVGAGFVPVPRAAAEAHVRARFGLHGAYVLHVGTLEPRKNHATLVAAFERLRRAGFPGRLVLAGREGWRVGPILARIASSPAADAIVRIADADDRDLVALYGAATACAYPSLEEGFGMPILESMVCATACVSSDHAALRELGEGWALQVPAADADALAEALIRVWRDDALRARLAAEGPARAAPYAFERWAPRIFALYARELRAAG